MKKILLVMFGVLLLIAIAADAWFRGFAEERASTRVAASLDLQGEPDIRLGGWPFVYRLFVGSFPTIEVRADELTVQGVTVEELHITMEDVNFDASDLLAGDADAVRASTGQGTTSLTPEGLEALVRDSYPELRLSVRGENVRVRSPGLPGAVTARTELRGDDLIITGKGLGEELVVPLPKIVRGIRFRSVSVQRGALRFRFDLEDARLVPGE